MKKQELKIKMTMYIGLREGETKEEALDRLDSLAFDNDMGYKIWESELQDLE